MLSKLVFLAVGVSANFLRTGKVSKQPIVDSSNTGYSQGKDVDNDAQFAVSAQDAAAGTTSGANYRNAWNDCGGIGASETERTRILTAKIKGFAKPVPFVRHAAQDCDKDKTGNAVNNKGVVFPGKATWDQSAEGSATAKKALART